ncbi:DUF302 domain-containing protein [Nostocoides sp. F2B08]|uniref:DUF302 domain-containing protein n=1 Tax=Nostocoides sp. F2B08 TaxID=2653936 RepID=UPI001263629E|nr:DUF302 domain-containing protein [Tetrasphaera sp. F2B08]KAB7745356.1 DUF302 domain-containing protein [Tetrasphaera sp. F2B08]
MAYSIAVTSDRDFDTTVAATREALSAEGFGILTEIDLAETLKQKIGADLDPYLILGACRPPLAQQAVAADPSVGTLLPCNVVVRVDGDHVVVEALDPKIMAQLSDGDALAEVTADAAERLTRALRTLKA